MKKFRKKIALIVALALTLAIAIPALAFEDTVIEATYVAPTIAITLPSSTEAVINPYSLPVKASTISTLAADDDGVELTNVGQIASLPIGGFNESDMPLKVGVSVIATTKGAFTFATKAPSASTTTKSGLVYLELANPTNESDQPYSIAGDAGVDDSKLITAFENWDLPTAYNAEEHVIVGKTAKSLTGIIKLAPAVDGEPVAEGCFVARLCGNVVQLPKTAWSAQDGFTATITWVIEPDTDAED